MTPIAPVMTGLFEPKNVAGLSLPNSFVMAPMTRSNSPHGIPTAENAAYYRRRAAGGIGLILTEGVLVGHPSAGHETAVPRMVPDAADGWRAIVSEVHAEGAAIMAQLWHVGSRRESPDGYPAWTPSGIDEHGRVNSYAMTIADIDTLVTAYADAARVAYAVGFDGVEIHAAHGYLVDEFLWAATNRREDCYGGSRRNRVRFAAEIVAAVRGATSPDFPIGVRFSQFKERAFAARLAENPSELNEILQPLLHAGATLLHASGRRFWDAEFDGSPLNLAGWAKRLTGLPTITVGSIGLQRSVSHGGAEHPQSLEALAARHAADEFDLVALGRILLGNPEWARLVREGRSHNIVDYAKDHEQTYW